MTLKKKMKIAAIVCSVGLCSFGQRVCASEFMQLPKESSIRMEHLVQTKLLKEQREYLLQAQLVTKINLEKQIQENLFQYEMGIELGADLEADKIKHRKIYEEKRRQIDHHKPNQ